MNCPRRKSELSTRHWNSTQKEQLKSMEIKNTKKITNIAKTFSKNSLQFVAVLGWFVGRGEAPMSPKSRKARRPSSVRIKFPACGSAWTKPVKTKLDTHAWWKCWNWWSKMWLNSIQFELKVVHMFHVWLVRPPQPYPEIQNATECIETYSNQLTAQTEANRSCAQLVLFSKDPPSSSSLPHFLFLAAFFHGSTPRSSDFVPMPHWSHYFRIQKDPKGPLNETFRRRGTRHVRCPWVPWTLAAIPELWWKAKSDASSKRAQHCTLRYDNQALWKHLVQLHQLSSSDQALLSSTVGRQVLKKNRAKESNVITTHQAMSCVQQVTDTHLLHLPNRRLAP